MNGSICNESETCDIEPVLAKDNFCCLGNCEEIKTNFSGRILGWGIVVIVVVFLIWFFKFKYKRAKKEVDLLKIAKKNKK